MLLINEINVDIVHNIIHVQKNGRKRYYYMVFYGGSTLDLHSYIQLPNVLKIQIHGRNIFKKGRHIVSRVSNLRVTIRYMVYIYMVYTCMYKVYLNGRHPCDKDKHKGRVRVMY